MEELKVSQEEAVKESLTTELDTIKAVFLNDMKLEEVAGENAHVNIKEDGDSVENNLIACTFSVNLLPSTADAKMEQFVALSLHFQIPVKYPEELPKIELKGPRGLSDEKVDKIGADLKKLAEAKRGTNMLYELIDFVKESLTAFNFPTGKCMICLYEFTKEDVFVKTECFHHFHSYCLAGYMTSVTEKRVKESEELKQKGVGIADTSSEDASKMPCPVCRLDCDLLSLVPAAQECYPAPTLSKAPMARENEILKEAREEQEKYSELFEKQQSQGGIIDDEEEKKRFLIRISKSPHSPNSGKNSLDEKGVVPETSNGKAQSDVPATELDASPPVASGNAEAMSSKSSEIFNDTSLSQNSLADNDKLTPKCIHVTPKSIDQNQSDNSQSIDLSLLSSKLETLKTDDVDKHTPDHTSQVEADIENPSKNQNKASAAQEKSSTEVVGKDKTEKTDSNTAPKQPRGNRRRRQRSRTKSGQAAAVKSDTEQAVVEGNQQRNSSRPRRGTGNEQYGQYRPRNRGRRRGRGRGRGRGNFANGGMASPPYRHNLNDGYGTETSEGRHRRSSYNGDYDRQLNGSRDRPGYYAARVFKPAQNTSRSHQTHNKSEDTVASGSQSNQTDVTSSEPAGIAARDGDGNRRGDRRRRYSRNRTRSGRFSEGDYYSDNGAAQYGYHNGNRMQSGPKNRQSSYAYYYRPNYQRSYYDQMNGSYYPPYNYYSYNRPSYGYNSYSGYSGYGYNYGGYGRGRGSYGGGRRSNYRQRNRSDTHESQSSARNEGNTSQKQVAAVNPVTSSPSNPTEVSP